MARPESTPDLTEADVLQVPGAPDADLYRSPAALTLGRLATLSGLRLAHHEHRVHLEVPAPWIPEGRDDLVAPRAWAGGVLPDGGFATYRHDAIVGTFDPGRGAKWTLRELCRALVGFAWRPDASLLFHALAARLTEILPTALTYFFDEVLLRRCPLHAGHGPLLDDSCPHCEALAALGPCDEPEDEASHLRWLSDGRTFVDRELAAVARSRRLGRLVSNRWGGVDLADEGLLYAQANALRHQAPEMRLFCEAFFPPGTGQFATLDELEARVRAVLGELLGETSAEPLAGPPILYVVQDVAWRLLCVRSSSSPEARPDLGSLVLRLADDPSAETIDFIIEAYEELHNELDVPPPNEVLAVGYDLQRGYGRSVRQVAEGIASVCPATLELLGWRHSEVIANFVQSDAPARLPLGKRFAAALVAPGPESLAKLAAFEATVAHAAMRDPAEAACGQQGRRGDLVRLGRGFELVHATYDVVELAQSLQSGRPVVPEEREMDLAVARSLDGEVVIADLTPTAAAMLQQLATKPAPRSELGLPGDEIENLEKLGILVPDAFDS